jgi:aldose 1-epimerase
MTSRTTTIRSGNIELDVSPRGATVRAVRVRGRDGRVIAVALAPADESLIGPASGYMGCSIGRCANRIGHGRFTLDGVEHLLTANEGDTALHGGRRGFDAQDWVVEHADDRGVRMSLVSPDGDQGFPGEVRAAVEYTVDGSTVSLTYWATCDAATPVNLTNHTYFNLSGEDAGPVDDHTLQVPAARRVAVDDALVPTGELIPVEGTDHDFRAPGPMPHDLDSALLLDGSGMREVAQLRSRSTGITLSVATDQVSLQAYSGGMLDGTIVGRGGTAYVRNAGVALETQGVPDAVNHPDFPTVILRPGEEYAARTTWRFAVS